MVQVVNRGNEIRLPEKYTPPADINKHYSEGVCITQPPRLNELRQYYKSTYAFSSPKRYKTVVYLEPRLAPVNYWRVIDFGISPELKHKSGVDCDFRPRPTAYSETAWIFPKQQQEMFKTTVLRNQLVDTTWYKTQVTITDSEGRIRASDSGNDTDRLYNTSSENESIDHDYLIMNNNNKAKQGKRPYGNRGEYSPYSSEDDRDSVG